MNNINDSFKDIKRGDIVVVRPGSKGLDRLIDKKFRVDSKWSNGFHKRLKITSIYPPQYSFNINFSNLVKYECATIEEDGEY